MAVVLNIDADHLDCYKDIDEIEETFGQFLHLLPENGVAIGKGTDERVVRQLSRLNCRTITFGLTADCDVHPAALTEDDNGYYTFDLCAQGNTLEHVKMGASMSKMGWRRSQQRGCWARIWRRRRRAWHASPGRIGDLN